MFLLFTYRQHESMSLNVLIVYIPSDQHESMSLNVLIVNKPSDQHECMFLNVLIANIHVTELPTFTDYL